MTDTIKAIEEAADHADNNIRMATMLVEEGLPLSNGTLAVHKTIKAALTVLQDIASGDDWFDIDTAPRDGTYIYAKHNSQELQKVCWSMLRTKYGCEGFEGFSQYKNGNLLSAIKNLTHWKPIDGETHIKMLMKRILR